VSGSPLFDSLLATPEVSLALDDRARLQGMLRFEAALARAQADVGIVPSRAADRITAACDARDFDLSALGARAAAAGNIAIPMVTALVERVGRDDPEAAKWVHFGATSQDVIDTGFALQLRDALTGWHADLAALENSLAALATREARTPTVGRTWLQHAVPITFGRKVAGWLAALRRGRRTLVGAEREACILQFGGAAGTLAVLGSHAAAVSVALGRELDLPVPAAPWHAERDRFAMLACALGVVVGTLGKIARDISLLAQTEVAEAGEPEVAAGGGSSAMPQKRNPVASSVALAAATRVPGLVATMLFALPQEHERGLSGWQAEWETLPEILRLGAGAARSMRTAVAGLVLSRERMRVALDNDDTVYAESVAHALTPIVGKSEAHRVVGDAVARARADWRRFRDVIGDDVLVREHLGATRLAELFALEPHLDSAEAFVRRVLDDDGSSTHAER
jgi:3-carboxy-cis,cis-muconate cycloisomerase